MKSPLLAGALVISISDPQPLPVRVPIPRYARVRNRIEPLDLQAPVFFYRSDHAGRVLPLRLAEPSSCPHPRRLSRNAERSAGGSGRLIK